MFLLPFYRQKKQETAAFACLAKAAVKTFISFYPYLVILFRTESWIATG